MSTSAATALRSINPVDGSLIQEWEAMDAASVDTTIELASSAWLSWRKMSFAERADCFKRLAQLFRDRQQEFASLMTREMGKPISQSLAESQKCGWVCDYFADHAEELLADVPLPSDDREAFATFQPIGVIYAIMPWNFPFWQVLRSAAPTMMAGNAFLLKHSPNVTGCAMAIEACFAACGFPEHLFRTLVIDLDLSPRVIEHPLVQGVTLTGSERAGRIVGAQAGAAIKKSVLELGGSDPYVILEDADLEEAAKLCVSSRMLNNGQVCISAKRFIVSDSIHQEFTDHVVSLMQEYDMRNPEDETCRLGPLAREDLRDHHHDQVVRSVEAGATLLMGGTMPSQEGWWYPATILSDVVPETPAFEEELFGPTAVIIKATDEADAVMLANDSRYGLGGAVFTRDLEHGRKLAREQMNVGCCAVNGFVKSDPRLPFGGTGDSGYGRELGPFGIQEFVNIKTVVVS
ncbi:MAG: NAD-dependent succinate-semialdehyde dehydrogenase [Phycisphaerales bacterium]|nr:NAD-dependent succinate-semialdehyde dehydrogenase [Phycisphaerales bacterium]